MTKADPLYNRERFQNLLRGVTYKDWTFEVAARGHWCLRVRNPSGSCNVTHTPLPWNGRWWSLSDHMTDGEVIQTAFLAIKTAEEHEMRERFTYKGAAIFDPHLCLERLVTFRNTEGAIEERT